MASSPEENLELVRGGLENWIAGEREKAIATFAEDLEVYVPPELGNAGTYRGIEQFRGWFQAWEEAWSEFEMSVESIEPVGERHVIALIASRGVGLGSGIEVSNELGWVLGVRDQQMDFLSLQPSLEEARAFAEVRERDGA
jgi:ketosteroid isomerase-like protein